MSCIYGKFVSAMYVLNIVFQALLTLLMPACALALIGWLLVFKLSLPEWIFAILLPIGAILGFISMIRFVLSAMDALTRLEEQNKKSKDKNKNGEG